MPRRTHRPIVERSVMLVFQYDPTEGVPSEADLVDAVTDAISDHEADDGAYFGNARVIAGKTRLRRVAIEVEG